MRDHGASFMPTPQLPLGSAIIQLWRVSYSKIFKHCKLQHRTSEIMGTEERIRRAKHAIHANKKFSYRAEGPRDALYHVDVICCTTDVRKNRIKEGLKYRCMTLKAIKVIGTMINR